MFVAGAVIGKLAGLALARRRLARSAAALALLLDGKCYRREAARAA